MPKPKSAAAKFGRPGQPKPRRPAPAGRTLESDLRKFVQQWHEAGWTDYLLAKEAGLKPHQVTGFREGETSLSLIAASRLAQVLKVCLSGLGSVPSPDYETRLMREG